MDIPSTDHLPPKEIEKVQADGSQKMVPNPAYNAAIQKFGEDMAEWLPKLKLRIGAATDAAEGLNVVYENLRRQRSLNFINEFKKGTEFRRIGLLEPNRFGEFLFDNDKEGTLARLKKHHELYFDNKAAATGIPRTQLMRNEAFIWSDAKTYDGGRQQQQQSKPRFRGNPNQGNFRGQPKNFRGGGGRQKPRGTGPQNARKTNNTTNNQSWNENVQDQPSTSGQNNRGKPKNNKRPWGGGGRGGQQ
jgi:hypothetical protein